MGGRGEGKKTELFSCFFYIKGKRSKSGHPRMPYKNKKVERLKNEEKESKMWMIYAYLVRSPPPQGGGILPPRGRKPLSQVILNRVKKKKNPLSVKDTTYSVDLKDRTLLISKLEIIGPPYTNIWSLCTSKYTVVSKNSLLNFTSTG